MKLQYIVSGIPSLGIPSSKKWLFLANPKSGAGKAVSIFKERVLPMLAEAAIDFELRITGERSPKNVKIFVDVHYMTDKIL